MSGSKEEKPTGELPKMRFAMCTFCSSDQNIRECTRCHAAAYCSVECQSNDWPLHKLLCNSFPGFLRTKPSVPEGSNTRKYVLGILYPEKENKPRLHWAPIKWIPASEDQIGFENYQQESFFGKGAVYMNPIQENPRTMHMLRSTVRLHFRDNFLSDGSVSNQALAVTTKAQHAHDWRGPLVVTRIINFDLEGDFCDLDLQDFRHVTDYFLSYGSTKSSEELFNDKKMSNKEKNRTGQSAKDLFSKGMEKLILRDDTAKIEVEGVKIESTDCFGGSASYTAVILDTDHEIFRPGNSKVSGSEIAARLGLPLRILRYPVKVNAISTGNVAATWLHINIDDKSDEFGWAPIRWQCNIGPILVVREDKVRITPRQMQILCNFCQHRMGPLFGDSQGENYPQIPMSRQSVLNAMTREKFEKFFVVDRAEHGWSGINRDKFDCRNPYTGLE